MPEKYKIKCSRGKETWYAYDGVEFEQERARTEVEGCRRMYPDVHFELEPVEEQHATS